MAVDAVGQAGGAPLRLTVPAPSGEPGVTVRRGHGRVSHPLHAHEALQVVLVEHGRAEFVVRGTPHAAEPGDVILVESWEPHAVRALPGGASVVMALVAPAVLAAAAPHEERSADVAVFPLAVRRDPALRRALRAVADLQEAGAARLAIDGAVVAAVAALVGVAAGAADVPGPTRGTSAAAVTRAVEHLRAHAREDVSLDDLAAAAHLSKYHLAREFTRRVGRPPHAYQLHVRLGQARHLLVAGRSSAEVAQTLGFADQSHFTLAFRRAFGVTPGRFVRALGTYRHRRTT
jgi:AraC-like DNA-binding protein/mannose-6-phosphate isomerase-like protein (cupin superfamily)